MVGIIHTPYTHTYIYACSPTHMYIHIHTCIHMYTREHTHIHTYSYTFTLRNKVRSTEGQITLRVKEEEEEREGGEEEGKEEKDAKVIKLKTVRKWSWGGLGICG